MNPAHGWFLKVTLFVYVILGLYWQSESVTAAGEELTEGNMNEGGWNLVDHSSAQASETNSNSDGSPEKEFTVPVKQASFAWRGGQERQTTGEFTMMAAVLLVC
jgi:hypothetical protein